MEASCSLFGVCGPLRDFRKSLQHKLTQAKTTCMEKALEVAWVGLQAGCCGVSGNPHGRANSIRQVDGDSDIVSTCLCRLIGGRSQQRNNSFCQHFFLGKCCSSSPCPAARQFSSSLYVPGTFGASAPFLELRGSETVSK